ncbi:hypothetical protein VTL71DRAFT_9901 [Oculimacula yallundae]|uniref:Uncharacterized protein n=1 Tax=Oculimacula yallundae TaxID=86028 RepID=A0ABR4BSQ5_9HELO
MGCPALWGGGSVTSVYSEYILVPPKHITIIRVPVHYRHTGTQYRKGYLLGLAYDTGDDLYIDLYLRVGTQICGKLKINAVTQTYLRMKQLQ